MSDVPTGYPGAPPDWYDDPAGGPNKRWWDGYAWTDALYPPKATADQAPAPAPPRVAPPSSGTPPAELRGYGTAGYGTPWYSDEPAGDPVALFQQEFGFSRTARIAVLVPPITAVLSLFNLRVHAPLYRRLGHEYHAMIQAQQNGQTPQHVKVPDGIYSGVGSAVSLFDLLSIIAIIVLCLWQYRAASTARALGHPAKHAPGWGVGCWFVPIVDLWMPYQVLRDCFGVDNPHRAEAARFWALLIGAWAFTTAATVAALFSSPVALGLSAPALVLWIGFMATGPRLITAIAVDHQHAIRPPGTETPVSR